MISDFGSLKLPNGKLIKKGFKFPEGNTFKHAVCYGPTDYHHRWDMKIPTDMTFDIYRYSSSNFLSMQSSEGERYFIFMDDIPKEVLEEIFE